MSELIKSKKRVSDHGEVFTPKKIVLEMCDLFSTEDWSDPSSIFLEPTCGNGNFVVEIIRKQIENGLSVFDAVNSTFGMDIMADNILECRIRVYDICKEFENDPDKIFRLVCVIVNNFFRVDDSLEFMKSGKWAEYKFYDHVPTTKENVGTGLNKFMKNNTAPQIKNRKEQEKIEIDATEIISMSFPKEEN